MYYGLTMGHFSNQHDIIKIMQMSSKNVKTVKNLKRRNYWADLFQIWFVSTFDNAYSDLFILYWYLQFSIFSEFFVFFNKKCYFWLLLERGWTYYCNIWCVGSLGSLNWKLFILCRYLQFSIFSKYFCHFW